MCHYIINGSTISKFIQIKGNIYLGKSHHCFTISSCEHVYSIHLMSIIHDINQHWKLEFYWNKTLNVFFGGNFHIVGICCHRFLIYNKKYRKIRIFKEGKKENFTLSMSIGYYFLFWWFSINKSPINAKFVFECSPLWLHHKFWF